MIFSVYNHPARCFDYYEAPGTSADYGARGTKYRTLSEGPQGPTPSLSGGRAGIGPVGFAPEALAMPLPAGARQVGRGERARGVVAVRNGGSSGAALWPASPGRYEEEGGTIQGLGGLGADENVPAAVPSYPAPSYPFGQVVAAACIAAVVGVLVQRMLK